MTRKPRRRRAGMTAIDYIGATAIFIPMVAALIILGAWGLGQAHLLTVSILGLTLM
jgi:hypothetical protein